MEICDQKLSESSERTYCPELTYFNFTLLSYLKSQNKEPNSVTGVKFVFNLSLLYVILDKIPCYDNDYDYDHRSDSERSKQFKNAKSRLHSIEHATKTKLMKIHKLVKNINPVFRFLSSHILLSGAGSDELPDGVEGVHHHGPHADTALHWERFQWPQAGVRVPLLPDIPDVHRVVKPAEDPRAGDMGLDGGNLAGQLDVTAIGVVADLAQLGLSPGNIDGAGRLDSRLNKIRIDGLVLNGTLTVVIGCRELGPAAGRVTAWPANKIVHACTATEHTSLPVSGVRPRDSRVAISHDDELWICLSQVERLHSARPGGRARADKPRPGEIGQNIATQPGSGGATTVQKPVQRNCRRDTKPVLRYALVRAA